MNILLGIDLGGTKIEGIAINAGCMNLQEICRLRIQTESELGYQHILQRLKEMAHMLAQKTGTKPSIIGLGHPGSEDPQTKTLKNSNTLCLNGQSLLQDLESALGIQVAAANDANCFALAESRFGAGRGAQIVFGVIMGTGVGGGIVVDGKVISGAQGIAGEWGHNVLDERGPRCYCGKSGCVETILSGPALERFYAARTGAQVPLKVIAEHAAKHTDDAAVETIERLCCYFGRAIAAVVNILDPDRI
ncbi:MAG TPA: ROK family protein, partial [Oligoflexia bacterium]|nr:ROK family protein [Oligoflexia bacterium]